MSNINLVLSNAVAAARGDRAAQAAGIVEGIVKSFAQYAQHGQKTPFMNGIAAVKDWRGELGQAIEGIILSYYQEAKSLHESRTKPTASELEVVEARVTADVAAAYAAEETRREAKRAEAKAKREAARLTAEAEATKAGEKEAADAIATTVELAKVRDMLSRTVDERDTLAAELAAVKAERDTLAAELAAVKAAQTVAATATAKKLSKAAQVA